MFGFIKTLLRKRPENPAENETPAQTETDYNQEPAPYGQAMVTQSSRPNSNGNGFHQAGKGIELPLQSILSNLPLELQPRVKNANVGDACISIPLEKVLAQLSRGAVKISFGELRMAAPYVFAPGNDRDRVLVPLPLSEIIAQLNPALITRRRVQKHVEVPEEVSSPFDPQAQGLIFSIGPAKAQPAPAPNAHAPRPAPAAPHVPAAPVRSTLTSAPTPPPPGTMPPGNPVIPTSRSHRDFNAAPAPKPAPPAPAKPAPPTPTAKSAPSAPATPIIPRAPAAPAAPAAPIIPRKPAAPAGPPHHNGPASPLSAPQPIAFKPAPAPAPTPAPIPFTPAPVAPPAPSMPQVPAHSTESLPHSDKPAAEPLMALVNQLAEGWPEAIRHEIVQLDLVDAKIALPAEVVERGLKQGRLAFTWKMLRSWVKPAPMASASANDSAVLELPLKVVAPMFLTRQREANAGQQKVQVDENIPNLFFGFPQAEPAGVPSVAAATAKPADTNYYVWDDSSDTVRVHESDVKRGPSPETTFVAKYATPNEVVSRAAGLEGVEGSLIALPDGLMVASRLPQELNGDTLAAFLPQIFGKVSQCTKELRMGDLNNLNFTVGNVPWKIFRVNAIFFAAFGRSGQSLPTAQLAALAAELDHKPK